MTATDPFESMHESPSGFVSGEEASSDCEKPEEKPDTDDASFEIPRPLLTVQQAAAILGKSVRTLERSLLGRWGNKLPDGWGARKIKTAQGEEWRIVPPPGFRVRSHAYSPEANAAAPGSADFLATLAGDFLNEPARPPARRSFYHNEHSLEQPTIVIDRSEEVENLLRELLVTQKALSEERRLHMEDLRIVAQLQGHMRLLESSASESARSRQELELNKRELEQLKAEYNQIVALPWWKRLFGFGFKRT